VTRPLLTLLLVPALGAAAPVPKEKPPPPLDLDGTWESVEVTIGGGGAGQTFNRVWVIEGEQVTESVAGRGGRLQQVDTRKLSRPDGGKAGEVDFVSSAGGRVTVNRSVVERKGDELVVCYPTTPDTPRPAELKAGSGVTFIRFQRVTDAKK
jgi:hypothetical protein